MNMFIIMLKKPLLQHQGKLNRGTNSSHVSISLRSFGSVVGFRIKFMHRPRVMVHTWAETRSSMYLFLAGTDLATKLHFQ